MPPPVVKRSSKPPRAPRADAARNRERILATALEMFASGGVGVAVEDIAKRAEVGIGTLYRHFPTKGALIAAIVVDRFEQMTTHAERGITAKDPRAALEDVLERMVDQGATKKDFIDALGGTDHLTAAGITETKKRFRAAIAALLERAQATGGVRADVTANDVIGLVRGISMTATDARSRARSLAIVLAGLRSLA